MKKLLLALFGLLPKRPAGHPPFAFRDLDGVEFFAWSDLSEMPPARVNEIEDVLLQIDGCMTEKTRSSIAEGISGYIQEAMQASAPKAKGNALAKANYLATELLARRRKIIPEECYFALAAICAVRKDEDPYTFDRAIHAEKVESFKLAGRAGHVFFCRSKVFSTLLNVSLCTVEGLRSLQENWIQERARNEAILSVLRLPPSEQNAEKSSDPLSKTPAMEAPPNTRSSSVGT